jgi:dienelactone hydrolase
MVGGEVTIRVKGAELGGELRLPSGARGLVLFAHGSGSSRHSQRNQYVAGVLRDAGLGTLLFDLLSAEEEQAEARTRHLRFDIPILAERLVAATRWALQAAGLDELRLGYFGSSTGAAAALTAAAELGKMINGVVSRGGRADLAANALPRVTAATLLIVGGNDEPVFAVNQEAYGALRCQKELRILSAASHLFEEPGALEEVARMAAQWFAEHLR